MQIMDIFCWAPEISLEELKSTFINYKNGIVSIEYTISEDLPSNALQNIVKGRNQLLKEGKKVAFIIKDCKIVALIGYLE